MKRNPRCRRLKFDHVDQYYMLKPESVQENLNLKFMYKILR